MKEASRLSDLRTAPSGTTTTELRPARPTEEAEGLIPVMCHMTPCEYPTCTGCPISVCGKRGTETHLGRVIELGQVCSPGERKQNQPRGVVTKQNSKLSAWLHTTTGKSENMFEVFDELGTRPCP